MLDAVTKSWLEAVSHGPDLPGRAAARATFEKSGLPHRRMEDWKYTDVRNRLREALPLAEPLSAPTTTPTLLAELGAPEIAFGNGRYLGTKGALPKGVSVNLLQGATVQDWVHDHFGKGADKVMAPDSHPIVALNTALFRDGAALGVAAGAKAGAIILSHDGRSGLQAVRNRIVVEEGAELTLIETHCGADEAQQVLQVTEIMVAERASLTHIRLQDEGAKTVHLATDFVTLAESATYRGFVVTTGGELSRNESHIELTGAHAHAEISGTYLISGSQHADITTRVHHNAPHCTSREIFKGVIADEARGVFQGKILVARDAQKTDGHMLNKTLLLSPKAEIDTKPELEIYADDVKCSHGATTGQIDEDQLFYLRARGIDEATARGLLIHSFITDVMQEVADENIRAALEVHVTTWLAAHAGVKEIAA